MAREGQNDTSETTVDTAGAGLTPVEGGKVRVPQNDGEIILSRGGETVLTKRVTDGLVSPRDDVERALLLASIPGATLDG